MVEVSPQFCCDRRCHDLQIRTGVGLFPPGRTRIAWLDRLPGDRGKQVVQLSEKVAAILMVNEAAEKLLIGGGAKALAQFLGEGCGRWVFLDRLFGVARYISHHANHFPGALQVRGKQQDAGQARVEDRQIMTAPWLPVQAQMRQVVEQTENQAVGVVAQVFLHLCQVQCSGDCGFLAVADFSLQDRRDHRVADAQIVFQIGFIALANVQLPAHTGKYRHRHFFQDLRQGQELPVGRRCCDVRRGRLEGICAGLGSFEIVQCGVQQRYRPDARSARLQS
ncbi:hypothetical protein D3C78_995740 [compost metagenome]